MLTTVEAYSSWQSAPLLPLGERGAESDLVQIRSIEGLGPVKANVNTSPFGSVDGESYTGSTVGSRNIVLIVGLNPDWQEWSMEELRRLLYSYFMPKARVRLIFNSDTFAPVEISGYVESVEPNIFAKDVEVVVSIICPDPYFTAVQPKVLTGFNSDGSDPLEIEYGGSVEAGINIRVIESTGPAPTNIGIQVGDPSVTFFRVAAGVSASMYLVMNSLPGQKYVQNIVLGSGVITNLLSKVESGSSWPTLQPGKNNFSVITNGGTQDWELTYFEKFGGL